LAAGDSRQLLRSDATDAIWIAVVSTDGSADLALKDPKLLVGFAVGHCLPELFHSGAATAAVVCDAGRPHLFEICRPAEPGDV
jgi:hypothetical protein